MGMMGKLCLDAEQAYVINEVMSPTQTDATWANDVITGFEQNGGVVRDGLWGGTRNKNPPRDWSIYPQIRRVEHSASDHALIYVDLDGNGRDGAINCQGSGGAARIRRPPR